MKKLLPIAKNYLLVFITVCCYTVSSAQDTTYQKLLLDISNNVLFFNVKDSLRSWILTPTKRDIIFKNLLNKNNKLSKLYSDFKNLAHRGSMPEKYENAVSSIEEYLSKKEILYNKVDIESIVEAFYENRKALIISVPDSLTLNQDGKDEKRKSNSNIRSTYFWKYISIILTSIISVIIFLVVIRKRKITNSLVTVTKKPDEESNQIVAAKGRSAVNNPNSSTNIKSLPLINGSQWTVMAASAIGQQHLKSNPPIPCQDSFSEKLLGDGWGIAVVCDGAGSKKNSHIGSKFVAEQIILEFSKVITDNKLIEQKRLPEETAWKSLCKKVFSKILLGNLKTYAEDKNIELDSLGCTAILLIYSPIGILASHIGDGRAGYCNEKGEWKPLITPHKGEEANQTVFITTMAWCTEEDLQVSGVSVPESIVINEKPTAFTLMSDGCENHAFQTGYFDKEKQLLITQNEPYPNFFNPVVKTIQEMKKKGVSNTDMRAKWQSFLEDGNAGLKNEPDDKTLILGILTD